MTEEEAVVAWFDDCRYEKVIETASVNMAAVRSYDYVTIWQQAGQNEQAINVQSAVWYK